MGSVFCYYNSMEKEMKNVKRIFLDMDGVLADFLSGVAKPEMIGHALTNDAYGHNEYDLRKEELTNKRLFAKLEPMSDMYDLIAYVKHCELPWEILTAAGKVNRELVVYDKNEWIRKHVDPCVVVTCTMGGKQKAAFANKGYVLVDDRLENIEAWEKAGGIGILHTTAERTIDKLKDLRKEV